MADDPVQTLLEKSPLSKQQKADLWDAYYNATDADSLASALKPLGVPTHVKANLWDLKANEAPAVASTAPITAETPSAPPRTWMDTAQDVGIGAVKGAARTVLGAGELVHKIPGVTRAVDALYGQPGLSDRAFQEARKATEATNTAQMVGKGIETLGELAIPVSRVTSALPSTAKAGAKFQEVMSAAKNVPVDVNAPGKVALRIQELAEHGGSMPMSVRKFINYVTDPKKPPMTYEVARDFASNISRLSADEFGRLSDVLKREVADLRVTLNKATADAASRVGKGREFSQAMNEYAKAKKIRSAIDSVLAGARKSAPYGIGAGLGVGTGYYLGKKLVDLWGGE